MATELKKVGAPAELHVYATGGHGFGLRPASKDKPCTAMAEAACGSLDADHGFHQSQMMAAACMRKSNHCTHHAERDDRHHAERDEYKKTGQSLWLVVYFRRGLASLLHGKRDHAFQLRCACGKNLNIKDEWVGKKIRCTPPAAMSSPSPLPPTLGEAADPPSPRQRPAKTTPASDTYAGDAPGSKKKKRRDDDDE